MYTRRIEGFANGHFRVGVATTERTDASIRQWRLLVRVRHGAARDASLSGTALLVGTVGAGGGMYTVYLDASAKKYMAANAATVVLLCLDRKGRR